MALTAYTTIQRVRRAAGIDIEKIRKENVATGDGTTVAFQVRYQKIVSKDYLGTPASADIYVYLDNSDTPESSSNYTVTAEEGIITFGSAPSAAEKIEVTYWHSPVSDDDIEENIGYADTYINDETGRSYFSDSDTKLQHTQHWDGNGRDKTFFFERMPLFTVQSITVDSNSTLVENDDYYLYPTSAEAYWITFETIPTIDNKNISITYEYGQVLNDLATRLSTNLAAQECVEAELARRGTSGSSINVTSSGKIKGSTNRYVNILRALRIKEDKLWKRLGRKTKARSIM